MENIHGVADKLQLSGKDKFYKTPKLTILLADHV